MLPHVQIELNANTCQHAFPIRWITQLENAVGGVHMQMSRNAVQDFIHQLRACAATFLQAQAHAITASSTGRQLNQACQQVHHAQAVLNAVLESVFLVYAHMQLDAVPQRLGTVMTTKNVWHMVLLVK